jgi:hypothetical protein
MTVEHGRDTTEWRIKIAPFCICDESFWKSIALGVESFLYVFVYNLFKNDLVLESSSIKWV